MFSFLNFNFCGDEYALDVTPTYLNDIVNVQLFSSIINHMRLSNIDRGITSGDIPAPEDWDIYTILNCDFNNNVSAGNIDATVAGLTSIKIKRRLLQSKYDTNFNSNWITLKTIPVKDSSDLTFSITDTYARHGETYQYAFVPVLQDIEGDYIMADVESKFNGIYIADATGIYRLKANVSYGDTEVVSLNSVLEPVGSKYPIVMSNADTNYHRGNVSGLLLPKEYFTTHKIEGDKILYYQNLMEEFLHNGMAKIFKDWNGRYWLVMMDGSTNISYIDSVGLDMVNVEFNWVEIGDANDASDLYNNGLTEAVE